MDDNPRPAKRPRRNAPRIKDADSSRDNPPVPKPVDTTKSKPVQDIRFLYSRKDDKDPKEPWEEAAWDREDAFSELLRQWRADLASMYDMNSAKFAANVEATERKLDGDKVEIVYRVRKPRDSQEPLLYLGHVRYRGNSDGEGTVDIVTRGLSMYFRDVDVSSGAGQQPPRKSIGNPKLEKAILVLMDDDRDHLHRVRLMSGQHELQFKFDGKPANYFSARQREVHSEERDWVDENISLLEADTGTPSSEARPWQDTLLAIGEPPDPGQGRREKVYDSCGRTENNKWARIKEQDFRNWTKRALFLFSHNFVGAYKSLEDWKDCNWFYTSKGEIIHDDRFSGRLYLDGLQLCRWEFTATAPRDHGLKYAYNLRRGSEEGPIETQYTVMSPEAEAQAIAAIWKTAVYEYPKLVCDLLHRLLRTSVPPYRDSVNVVNYLDEDVAPVLSHFLTRPDTKAANGKRLWYISASASNTETGRALMAMKESSDFECDVLPDTYWLSFGKSKILRGPGEELRRISEQARMDRVDPAASTSPTVSAALAVATHAGPATVPSLSPAASTRSSTDKTSPEKSTEPSTEPSVECVTEPSGGSLPEFSEATTSRGQTVSSETSADLLAQAMMTGPDNVLLQRIQQLEKELNAARERASELQTELNERTITSHSTTGLGRRKPQESLITDASVQTDVVMDDAADERVFPVPSGYFPNEVMRLVQACLTLCPEPINTFNCRPIEGGTGLVVAGFCQLDHGLRVLKIHKDWLSMDRMRQHFDSPEDTTQTDLLCHTILSIWEELLKSESPDKFDKQDGRGGWARCRAEIRRRLLDYRQVCRQIVVPEPLRKYGELSVLTSNLANSGWAKENDNIHLSFHYQACPWVRRSYNTWKADPFDRHFTDITAPEDPNRENWPVTETRCDPCRSCHGVTKTGAARVPLYALKFEGLDPRKRYFVVARNLSQPDSLIVILDGLYYPAPANNAATPLAAKWCSDMETMLKSYIARGCLFQPLFLNPGIGHDDAPQQLPWPEPSRAPQASRDKAHPSRLKALRCRLKKEQDKLDELKEAQTPDETEIDIAKAIVAALQKQVTREQRQHVEAFSRLMLGRHPPPTISGPLAPPQSCGPPPRAAASGPSAHVVVSGLRPPFTTSAVSYPPPPPQPLPLQSQPVPSPPTPSSPTSVSPRQLQTQPPSPPSQTQPPPPLPRPATTQPTVRADPEQLVVHDSIVVRHSSEPAEGVEDDNTAPRSIDAERARAKASPVGLAADDTEPLGKEFYALEGDDGLAPQLISARRKICRQWHLSPEQVVALFPGMSASRAFMVNLSRIAEKCSKEDTLSLLEKARVERRKISRGQSWMGVSIFDEWTVKDTRNALEYAGLADGNRETPESRGSTPNVVERDSPSIRLSRDDMPAAIEQQAPTENNGEQGRDSPSVRPPCPDPPVPEQQASRANNGKILNSGSPAEVAARRKLQAAVDAYDKYLKERPRRTWGESEADASRPFLQNLYDAINGYEMFAPEVLKPRTPSANGGAQKATQATHSAAPKASGYGCIATEGLPEPTVLAPGPAVPSMPTREPAPSVGGSYAPVLQGPVNQAKTVASSANPSITRPGGHSPRWVAPETMNDPAAALILRTHIMHWNHYLANRDKYTLTELSSLEVLMPDKSGCRTAIDQLRTKLARAKVAHLYYQQKSACYPMRVPKGLTQEFAQQYAVTEKQMAKILTEGRKVLRVCDKDWAQRGLVALGVEERTEIFEDSLSVISRAGEELLALATRFAEKVEKGEAFHEDLTVLDEIEGAETMRREGRQVQRHT